MPTPAPTPYPLAAPSISNDQISVDQHLNDPKRIHRFSIDYLNVNRQRFLIDLLLDNLGGLTGGAVIADVQGLNDFYALRDVQQVAPMSAFPLLTFQRTQPIVATPKKWGAEFEYSYEARDRNNIRQFARNTVQMNNTIIRKLNQETMELIATAISSLSGAAVIPGNDWTAFVPDGSTPTNPQDRPSADFAKVVETNDLRELGVTFDTLIIHPSTLTVLSEGYGGGQTYREMLRNYGITTVFSTPLKSTSSVFVIAGRGQVGGYSTEQPLETVSVEEKLLEKFTVKSSARVAQIIDNPYGILEITGVLG